MSPTAVGSPDGGVAGNNPKQCAGGADTPSTTEQAEAQSVEFAGLLLTLGLLPKRWVHRRVETCEFLDERTAHRRVSLDFTLEPRNDIDLPSTGVLSAVPVAFLSKDPMRNF